MRTRCLRVASRQSISSADSIRRTWLSSSARRAKSTSGSRGFALFRQGPPRAQARISSARKRNWADRAVRRVCRLGGPARVTPQSGAERSLEHVPVARRAELSQHGAQAPLEAVCRLAPDQLTESAQRGAQAPDTHAELVEVLRVAAGGHSWRVGADLRDRGIEVGNEAGTCARAAAECRSDEFLRGRAGLHREWGGRPDSNRQQLESQSRTLPLSYGHHCFAQNL